MRNELKNIMENAKTLRAIGGAILIGAIALVGACSTTKTETSANNAANAAPSIAVNKPAANAVPDKPAAVNLNNGKMPKVVVDAGEFAENIYDFAKAKDWAKAESKLTSLEKAVGELKAAKLDTPQLDETIGSLDKAIKEKNEIDARREANRATFLVADIAAQYNPKVPVEVTKLDFYGREIEIAATAKDETKLKQTAQAIRETWNAVKTKIEAKGASKVAAKFESLVAQTEKAATVADYAKVATPILDEVDNLEKVFE